MELLVIIGAGILIPPVILLFSVIGAYSRIRSLEDITAQLRRNIDTLVQQHRNGSQEAPVAPQSEAASHAPPAGSASDTDHHAASVAAPAMASPPSSPAVVPQVTVPPVGTSPATSPPEATPPAANPLAAGHSPHLQPPVTVPPPVSPGPLQRTFAAAIRWLVTGNLVAKLGLVILFLGISFLLKYVAVRLVIPVELRIAAIAAADIALLAWGWRIRAGRRSIGLPVQGAAIAILMLLVFASYRMYALIPGGAAFALLFLLTVFTCLLAVMQNAAWLALFGIAGGFLAPILTSSGTGNHIALFSYYAVLNAGILAIALQRSWRALNLIGLGFTSVIGIAWAMQRYTPDDYLSAQCFLLLFFLFFTAISLVYAFRQSTSMKNPVDGMLVFGVPLVGAALQWALVRDIPYAVAFSALGGGMLYTGLALALWRRHGENMRLLVESFLAMGVVLGTVVIPLALDARWTSAAWAVEGAVLAWIGLRHGSARTWGFGVLVQLAGWCAFLLAVSNLTPGTVAEARLWLGFLILAASSGVMSRLFSRADRTAPGTAFDTLGVILLCFATAWLLAGTWTETALRTEGAMRSDVQAATGLLLSAALSVMAVRAGWHGARGLGLAVQLLAGVTLLIQIAGHWQWSWQAAQGGRPVIGVLLVTAAAFFTAWRLARARQLVARRGAPSMFAWAALWWFGPLLDTCAGYAADWTGIVPLPRFLPFMDLWPAHALCLAASSVLLAWLGPRLRWRSLRWLTAAGWVGLAMAILELLLELYAGHLPPAQDWIALGALLVAGEYLLHRWPSNGWRLGRELLLILHTLRSAGPWLMIWPLGFLLIGDWLAIQPGQRDVLAEAGWETTGSWARFMPLWAQMGVAGWLLHRARMGGWPARPVPEWYGGVLLPLAAAWTVFNVLAWNLTQDGAMAPLPYLPLANPLDLSTGFATVLVLILCRGEPGIRLPRAWQSGLPWFAVAAAFAWLNLIVLRSASHWLDLPYRADALFASRTVQAALSLLWSMAALVLMRRAVSRLQRQPWLAGAAMLGLVVAKLFLVDLAASGSMARIVSFVGVGLLMLAIGYLAPYPASPRQELEKRKGDPA
ncbi:DUF2339 domain-containing protein [Pseudoduganella sp. SL102]|uniref:DUF2339 domain-containing protein n=1 Tax=Pseudoduganella sp. SL102 TaxID=2995154 RepID=UPI00248B32E0|nr:DUF2339 domain-containing protein [Pseudoduganella sp. SL102]WBS04525.1 DUF2339 domain-containing protein [Pseudoduganella sp. SL102]